MSEYETTCPHCRRVFILWTAKDKTVECPYCHNKTSNPRYQPQQKAGAK